LATRSRLSRSDTLFVTPFWPRVLPASGPSIPRREHGLHSESEVMSVAEAELCRDQEDGGQRGDDTDPLHAREAFLEDQAGQQHGHRRVQR